MDTMKKIMNNVFKLFDGTNEVVENAVTDFIIDAWKNAESIDCLDISKGHIKVDVQNSFTDEYLSYTLNEVLIENGNKIIISAFDNLDNYTNLCWKDLTLIDKVLIGKCVYNNLGGNLENI